jgi:hypothetical protein
MIDWLNRIGRECNSFKADARKKLYLPYQDIFNELFERPRESGTNTDLRDALWMFRQWVNGVPDQQRFQRSSTKVKDALDKYLFINFTFELVNTQPTLFFAHSTSDAIKRLNQFTQGVTNNTPPIATKIANALMVNAQTLQNAADKEEDFYNKLKLLLYAELLKNLDATVLGSAKVTGAVTLLETIDKSKDWMRFDAPETFVQSDSDSVASESGSPVSEVETQQSSIQIRSPTRPSTRPPTRPSARPSAKSYPLARSPAVQLSQTKLPAMPSPPVRPLPSVNQNATNRTARAKKTLAQNREDKLISNQLTMLIFTMMQ